MVTQNTMCKFETSKVDMTPFRYLIGVIATIKVDIDVFKEFQALAVDTCARYSE